MGCYQVVLLATQRPVSSLELCPRINEKKNCHSISVSCFLHPVPEATGVEVEDVDDSVMKTIMATKNVFIFPADKIFALVVADDGEPLTELIAISTPGFCCVLMQSRFNSHSLS